jgi:hypothetical protein
MSAIKEYFRPDYDYIVYLNIPDMYRGRPTITVIKSMDGNQFSKRVYTYTPQRANKFRKLAPDTEERVIAIQDWIFSEGVYDMSHPMTGGHIQDMDCTMAYIYNRESLEKAFNWIAEKEKADREAWMHDDAWWCFERLSVARWVSNFVTNATDATE